MNMNKQNTTNKSITFWGFALALVLSFVGLSNSAFAANHVNVNKSGYAIKGYDTVAYFTVGKATKGDKKFTAEYQGNKYAFASEANKQAFVADPQAYAPQYGGFCAFAASRNAIAKVDPEAWTIHDNKLYLNYSKSVRETWSEKTVPNIVLADANWPTLKNKTK